MSAQTQPERPQYHKGLAPQKSCFRKSNEFRARVIRFFSCPTPGLKNGIPIVGGRTMIEVIGLVGLMVLVLAIAVSGGSTNAANVTGLFCILLALRYNYALKLLNLSFERALFWHKVMAVLFLATMIIHASEKGANASGLLIVITAGIMSFAYLFKPYQFELFYYLHLFCLILCCIGCIIHGAVLVFIGGVIWICDVVLRYGIFAKRITMKAYILPGNVVRLEFPHSFSYEAGQYCFLRIYDINPFEYHPFSLSSSPTDEVTTIHIRALGNWTKKLLSHVAEKRKSSLVAESNESGDDGVSIDVLVEGPFGMSMVDWENREDYQTFLLVSGGVGITPMQSVFSQLIHQQQNEGRIIRKAVFVWSVRDMEMVSAFNETEEGHYTHRISHIGARKNSNERRPSISMDSVPKNFQPHVSEIPEVMYGSDDVGRFEDNEVASPKASSAVRDKSSTALQESLYSIQSPLVFLPQFHITSLRQKEVTSTKDDMEKHKQAILQPSRPNLPQIFSEMKTLCQKEGLRRVAVLVCGPQNMVNEVDDLCRQSKNTCDNEFHVSFDCHKEVFDF